MIRPLRFLSSEARGLHAAAYVLAICAILSSLLALIRDRLLAHYFGASVTLDLYYAGFRLPDLIFVATGALVSVYMLIPELARRSESAQKEYMDTILAGFSVFAVCVSIAGGILAPHILPHIFPQFAAHGDISELVTITRILLLQPILLGLSNILASVTQFKHRYALYSISPLLYNLAIIFGTLVLYPVWGIAGLAWGVVLGALLHAGVQIPSILSDGFFAHIPRVRDWRELTHTALVSVPRALSLSMSQLAFLGLTALAGSLTVGSIAVFQFAYNLQAVPLAVIGASYSVAAFPTLAAALSKGSVDEFIGHVAIASRYVFFWSLPASALILVLRAYMVRVILGSGAFNWNDTRLTAAAFALFSLSLAAQGLTLLLVRGYYAAGRTFVPFIVSTCVALSTILLGFLSLSALSHPGFASHVENLMRVESLPGSSVLGLAFSYAIATILGTIILMIHFEYRFGGYFRAIRRAILESAVAALAAGLGAYIFLELASSFTVSSTVLSVLTQGGAAGICGILVAALAYQLIGSREYQETYASLHTRIWKRPAGAAEVTLVASAESESTTVG